MERAGGKKRRRKKAECIARLERRILARGRRRGEAQQARWRRSQGARGVGGGGGGTARAGCEARPGRAAARRGVNERHYRDDGPEHEAQAVEAVMAVLVRWCWSAVGVLVVCDLVDDVDEVSRGSWHG
ncbi:hypothetical protein R5R35_006227 [Gryllus longicercus]|uniref:Uncharacterized protein n=1 Tax=Gryllus longicercus TaxID=2509291 RepID=A0AAN9W4R5_9ORTH